MQTPLPRPHYWQWKRQQCRKVRHMTCIRMGMFLIMREEECAKWKVGCCTSKRVILKGNVGVKGKVIPCMLSLIKYVAQRKCALFNSLARPPLAANQVMHTALHIQVKILKSVTCPHRKVILQRGLWCSRHLSCWVSSPDLDHPEAVIVFFLSHEQIHPLSCSAHPTPPLPLL